MILCFILPPLGGGGGGLMGVFCTVPSGPYWHRNCDGGFASPLSVSCLDSVHWYLWSFCWFSATDCLIAASFCCSSGLGWAIAVALKEKVEARIAAAVRRAAFPPMRGDGLATGFEDMALVRFIEGLLMTCAVGGQKATGDGQASPRASLSWIMGRQGVSRS